MFSFFKLKHRKSTAEKPKDTQQKPKKQKQAEPENKLKKNGEAVGKATPPSRAEIGKRGEQSAASFLAGKGYTVIDRNCRIGHLELDIVARNDENVVFVEVKTRRAYPGAVSPYGRPANAVTKRKGARITCAATEYMQRHKDELSGLIPRYDIIEVYLSPKTEVYKVLKIIHMENTVSYS